MVRLSDLHQAEAEHMRLRAANMPEIECGPWLTPKPLEECTVALVSTAGMHRRIDPPFKPGATDYRILPGGVDFADVVLSHISTNFDRSAFQQDPNIMLPIDRLREMAETGEIDGVSNWHYSFMGAQPNPLGMEETGEEVGRLLAADGVDVALLIPV
jgi:D-proline reductase (dithiol) PrdB